MMICQYFTAAPYYGETGRAAIRKFLVEAHNKGYIDIPIELEFVQ